MTANAYARRGRSRRMGWAAHMRRYYWLYLFLIPGMVFLLLFKYLPIYGLQIAFKDYSIVRGIEASPWVGLKHFRDLFRSINFTRVLKNSILTSIFRLLWGFPMPILLALMMNEMCAQCYKRVMQSILYLPHFISWVVVISMLTGLLSQSTGVVNMVRKAMGMETIPFMNSKRWFRTVLIGAGIWKECGWGTVVYMAALSGIDPALYEAATIDGANRVQKITHITLPCIMGTVTVMLVMNMGNILSNGFEQIWLLQNALNKEVAEVLETYSYQVGLKEGRYSFATAVGMFQSLVGLIMIFGSNALSKRMGGGGLW